MDGCATQARCSSSNDSARSSETSARGIAFASDFDGTLCAEGTWCSFDERDIDAIRAFRARGGLFGISTGRSVGGLIHAINASQAPLALDFIIAATGSYVVDGTGRCILKAEANLTALAQVIDRFGPTYPLVVQGGDHMYTFSAPARDQVHIDSLQDMAGALGVSLRCTSPQDAQEVAAWINTQLGQDLVAYENVRNVDVVGRGSSKGRALRAVKAHVSAEQTAAIGDSYNDLSMLISADTAFTFADAPDVVKARVDKIVSSVSEALAFVQDL
ncbi:MAG: HAD-IIB family hydrolase [Atopobiaceae bacterium]|jgi:HAD superfamily hydrolase (TIGR01484 family)